MTNPLASYFRVPKLYVKLPSQGAFYSSDFLETSMNGEVAIYPLTAIDQILLKTPDAVLNGESMLKVLANCVPGVKNPKELVEGDINTLIVALRIATNGSNAEWPANCPECNTENNYNIDLQAILDTQSYFQGDASINFDDALTVNVRPYNFAQRHLQILNQIEENQTLTVINSREDLNDTGKISEVAKEIDTMAQRTFDLVAQSIVNVIILKTGEVVDNPDHIREFLKGITKNRAEAIMYKIRDLNQIGVNTETEFTCAKCNHQWKTNLDFDPTSFFE
jgi:T4 bacteriophage base plate protein